jgi:ribosomal protein S18 acetylase RimI-like enzyme
MDDMLVGTFSLRLYEPNPNMGLHRRRTYISSIGVLPEYRGQSIGRRVLKQILEMATSEEVASEVLLHVHMHNDKAYTLYSSEGFCVWRVVEDYYKGYMTPPAAYLMVRILPPSSSSNKQNREEQELVLPSLGVGKPGQN